MGVVINMEHTKEGLFMGTLINSIQGRDPNYYRKKRQAEAMLGRELTDEEFMLKYWEDSNYNSGTSLSSTGTSIFDPVLCELMYLWFTNPGDMIIDPFSGG